MCTKYSIHFQDVCSPRQIIGLCCVYSIVQINLFINCYCFTKSSPTSSNYMVCRIQKYKRQHCYCKCIKYSNIKLSSCLDTRQLYTMRKHVCTKLNLFQGQLIGKVFCLYISVHRGSDINYISSRTILKPFLIRKLSWYNTYHTASGSLSNVLILLCVLINLMLQD